MFSKKNKNDFFTHRRSCRVAECHRVESPSPQPPFDWIGGSGGLLSVSENYIVVELSALPFASPFFGKFESSTGGIPPRPACCSQKHNLEIKSRPDFRRAKIKTPTSRRQSRRDAAHEGRGVHRCRSIVPGGVGAGCG